MEEEFIRNQEQMKPLEEKQEVSTFIIVHIKYIFFIIIIVFIWNQKSHNLARRGITEYKYLMKESQNQAQPLTSCFVYRRIDLKWTISEGRPCLWELWRRSLTIITPLCRHQWDLNILSFVDKDLLEPGCSVLLNHKVHAVIGVLMDDTDPLVTEMKVEKAPQETYADIGGLDNQIQEIKESVELPLTHPEYYEEIGIKPPKGVILYGAPGTGKTLLAKAVANQTSATFLRVVGSELIQKYLCDGPKLVRELFRVAEEHAPSIVFRDKIDAIGTKRYDSNSGGEREIQRTMLELLNQLDGFDSRGDVKVIMATNRIETLDPALIRPGRIDRKIEFPLPDEKTKHRIFQIHTSRMTVAVDVTLDELILAKDDLSGADIKAICTEAGLMALRERRMKVTNEDFKKSKENVLYKKQEGTPEGLYL
uniref:Proteasome 26S subunit, ATPase 1a n=1 Tax=Cyprinus carpio TaxID=7962 RepID=A0A8C1S784_CYPCA